LASGFHQPFSHCAEPTPGVATAIVIGADATTMPVARRPTNFLMTRLPKTVPDFGRLQVMPFQAVDEAMHYQFPVLPATSEELSPGIHRRSTFS